MEQIASHFADLFNPDLAVANFTAFFAVILIDLALAGDNAVAVGLAAARARAGDMEGPIVTLATAHPAKFPDAVERASGVRPPLPRRIQHLFDREESLARLPHDAEALKTYIRERA